VDECWCVLAECRDVFMSGLALGSHIFRPLQVIHSLEGFSLFSGKCLLIIKFTWSAYPVEYNSATGGILEKEKDG